MSLGLTLGKFAPLHRGHQLLIESALAECGRAVVLVYDAPEVTDIPLSVRAGWVRTLYPAAEVIEGHGGPSDMGDTPGIRAKQEAYIRRMLDDRRVTHFYSSEFYGDHVSRALAAIDRRIDPDRLAVPVSGTAVRESPYENRRFLSPVVYRDLITRVVFVGAPSTGKTTLAETLAREFQTVWMPEYGREYWERHQQDRRLTPGQLVEIAEGHIEREDRLVMDANRYLFIDTDATTTHLFARYYHGDADPRLADLAEGTRDRYDLFFLCEDDIPYDATWDRSGEVHRRTFQDQTREDLSRRGIPFVSLRGSVAERIGKVRDVLAGYRKYPPERR